MAIDVQAVLKVCLKLFLLLLSLVGWLVTPQHHTLQRIAKV
jgi:hypothetical protein